MTVEDRHIASTAMDVPSDVTLAAPVVRRRGRRFRSLKSGALVLTTQIVIVIVLLVSWEIATSSSSLNAFLFGSPSAIWGFLVQMWEDGSLFTDTKITALETLLGFFGGNVIGTLIGLTLWYSRFVSRVLQPFIVAIGSIPIIALAPICIIWFGTGLSSKVAMATLSVVVVALITAYKGAMSVDLDQIYLMRTLGASKRHIFRKLIVPASLGDIFAGLKLTVGFALIGAIIGEFMSSSAGLGHAIFKAGSLYIIPKVFAALVVTIALALCLTYVVGKLEKLLTPWRQL
jgi:NitT/TauT family transport system permease protein